MSCVLVTSEPCVMSTKPNMAVVCMCTRFSFHRIWTAVSAWQHIQMLSIFYVHSVIYIASLKSSINDSIVSVSDNSLQPPKLYFLSDLGRRSASSWAGHISSFLFESWRRHYQVVNWLQKHHKVGHKCVVMVWSSGNGQNADCYSWQYWFSRCQKSCGQW